MMNVTSGECALVTHSVVRSKRRFTRSKVIERSGKTLSTPCSMILQRTDFSLLSYAFFFWIFITVAQHQSFEITSDLRDRLKRIAWDAAIISNKIFRK